MASLNFRLSEEEVNKIIIDTIREKFNVGDKTELSIIWMDDSGATISTPDVPVDKSRTWMDD